MGPPPPKGGVECRGGTQKSWLSASISGYQSDDSDMWATIATVHCAVYHTDGDASVNLVYHSLQRGRPQRREENLIIRSSKSEAEVTNNTRLRSMYCTKLPTGRHEALRGLSATAELGVSLPQLVSFPAVSCLALALSCLGLTLLWPRHESC